MQGARLKAGGRAFAYIAQYHPELTALRRDLHAHPELGFEEIYTSKRVKEALKLCGVDESTKASGARVWWASFGGAARPAAAWWACVPTWMPCR